MSDSNHNPSSEATSRAAAHRSVDEVPFSLLSDLYNNLRKAKVLGAKRARGFRGKAEADIRRSVLTKAWLKIAELCGYGNDILSRRNADDTFIPAQVFPPAESFKIICLLVPVLDSTHSYLGMKESKLADAFVRALDLVPNGSDAQWLKHHKEKEYRPRRWQQDPDIVDGNFPTVLKAILTDRCPSKSSLTVGSVWKALDDLSKASRSKSIRITRGHAKNESRGPERKDGNEELSWRDPGEGAEDVRSLTLRGLIQAGTAQEIAEVSRIILKDLDIRLSGDVFLSWFHPGAKQHYTQIHDIHQLLADCADPKFEIGEASVQVGRYASVMLTMRPSRKRLDSICENLRGKGTFSSKKTKGETSEITAGTNDSQDTPYFIMEPKLDGERLQLHKWKSREEGSVDQEYEIRTFSRKGNDSSAMYAGALREVILSAVNAQDIILDGEIMIWDNLRASWLRFEDTREVATAIAKKSVPDGASYTLKYMIFDVLYVDQGSRRQGDSRRSGNMVIRLPLYQRRLLLEKLVSEKEAPYGAGASAKIEIVEMERGHDERELAQALQRHETLGYEGVIAKNPDMPYALAERSLDVSIKLKPDYFDGGIQDLDVLILGAKYSSSRGHRTQRAGRLSSFLIGVQADDNDIPAWKGRGEEWEAKMRHSKWIPVGSVGTGYSDKDLAELLKEFQGEWKPFDSKDLPDHFEKRDYAPTLLSEVAKWIEPWKSVVVTIRAFEVNRRFYALRFPRMERINWDKPYYDVPTFGHLLDLDENKLPASIRPDEDDDDDVSAMAVKKKSRSAFDAEEEDAIMRVKEEGHIVTGGRNPRAVMASAMGADVSKVERLSAAFEGTCFHVIGGDPESKEAAEVQIHRLGGDFVQNLTSSVDFIVVSSFTLARVVKLKEKFLKSLNEEVTFPIIHFNWIEECMSKRQKVFPSLSDVFYATRKLERELYAKADRFGDPWEDDTTVESLLSSLREVSRFVQQDSARRKQRRHDDVEEGVRGALRRGGNVFNNMMVFVPETKIKLPGSVALLRAFGGSIVQEEIDRSTHILVHSSLLEEWKNSRKVRSQSVVTELWVQELVSKAMSAG